MVTSSFDNLRRHVCTSRLCHLLFAVIVFYLLLLYNHISFYPPVHDVLRSLAVLRPGAVVEAPAEEPVGCQTALASTEHGVSYDQLVDSGSGFDQSGCDLLVFLHVQKTGGSRLEKQLVVGVNHTRPCLCAPNYGCRCYRPGDSARVWLFSGETLGWRCGVHPAWTWLVQCVDKALDRLEQHATHRRHFYITLLRDPMQRYISEWQHEQRKGGWGVKNWCLGLDATLEEIAPCSFARKKWSDVTLDDFLQCDSNLANNRETWMLADLRLVQCYNNTSNMTTSQRQHRDQILLQSAKDNLRRMSFFGLTERQREGQWMFEHTFGMRFLEPLEQFNHTRARLMLENITQLQLDRIQQRNQLDIQLYSFAKQLFQQRLRKL